MSLDPSRFRVFYKQERQPSKQTKWERERERRKKKEFHPDPCLMSWTNHPLAAKENSAGPRVRNKIKHLPAGYRRAYSQWKFYFRFSSTFCLRSSLAEGGRLSFSRIITSFRPTWQHTRAWTANPSARLPLSKAFVFYFILYIFLQQETKINILPYMREIIVGDGRYESKWNDPSLMVLFARCSRGCGWRANIVLWVAYSGHKGIGLNCAYNRSSVLPFTIEMTRISRATQWQLRAHFCTLNSTIFYWAIMTLFLIWKRRNFTCWWNCYTFFLVDAVEVYKIQMSL